MPGGYCSHRPDSWNTSRQSLAGPCGLRRHVSQTRKDLVENDDSHTLGRETFDTLVSSQGTKWQIQRQEYAGSSAAESCGSLHWGSAHSPSLSLILARKQPWWLDLLEWARIDATVLERQRQWVRQATSLQSVDCFWLSRVLLWREALSFHK